MATIFNARNLTGGATYNSLFFRGKGIIKTRFTVGIGANIAVKILNANTGTNLLQIGVLTDSANILEVPEAYRLITCQLLFTPSVALPLLIVDFDLQYDYKFTSRSTASDLSEALATANDKLDTIIETLG